jgi:hypothetical protein
LLDAEDFAALTLRIADAEQDTAVRAEWIGA